MSRNVHIMGMGESDVEARLRELMVRSTNPTVAPYCQAGEVRLRVTARAADADTALAMCDEMIETIRKTDVAPYVYGIDVDNMETALVRELTARGMTVACAESCTGGMIGERITAVPGASQVFLGGCITYTNDMKIRLLGVDPALIDAHTEVSAEVAAAMADGARRALDSDIAIATTGYAGPGGGTEQNPVGTVYIGIATAKGASAVRLNYSARKSREYIRRAASSHAMKLALMEARSGANTK